MKTMQKRIISLFLAVMMIVSIIPMGTIQSSAATFEEINNNSVFLKQNTNYTCTLAAATMMVRRASMMNGNSSWQNITEAGMRSGGAWLEGSGLYYNFSYAGITVSHASLTGNKQNSLISLLQNHPEGIVLYYHNSDYSVAHAVLLTDYTNGIFYCADPANGIPSGRIPISSAYVVTINNATEYWYVSSPKCTLTPSNVSATGISLNAKQFTMNLGESKTITATVSPSNATNKTVTWSSSNTNAVTVSSSGVVKAVGTGGAVITATTASGGFKGYAEIVVNDSVIAPIDYMTYGGHYYEIYDSSVTWKQAKEYCELNGGHLAVIGSADENAALADLVKNKTKSGYYIGLTDADSQGTYKWVNGEENSYNAWGEGEPSNSLWGTGYERYQDYVLFMPDGTWNDSNNYINSHDAKGVGFICEYDSPLKADAVTIIDGKVYELYNRNYGVLVNDFAARLGAKAVDKSSANSKVINWINAQNVNTYAFVLEYVLENWLSQGNSLSDILFEELPDGADPNDYEIVTEYRSRDKSTTTSTAASMDGWTKYDSKITYGAWSKVQSSKTKPADSDTLQNVGTWTQYHYYHYLNYYSGCYNIDSISYGTNKGKHDIYINNALSAVSMADQGGKQAYGYYTCSEESPSFNIWFYAGSTLFYNYQTRSKTTTNYFYKWSEWSPWTATAITKSDNNEVETRTVYRLKENAPEPAVAVSSISIQSKPTKTVYTVGEAFNSSGLSVKVTMSDGTSKTLTSGFTVSEPDMTTAGTKTVTVTYEGKTATFNITVNKAVSPTVAQYKISGATATAGSTVEVYVSIENNPGIISLRNKITYDTSVMELVKVEDMKLLAGYTTPSPTVSSPYTLRWADSLATENNKANGNFVKLTFKIKDSAEVGDYGIYVTHIESRTAIGEKIEFADCSAVIKVIDYLLGDVDGNGEIDDWDAILLNRYLAGWQTEIIEAAAEIDGDGELTDWDAIALERRLAGWDV